MVAPHRILLLPPAFHHCCPCPCCFLPLLLPAPCRCAPMPASRNECRMATSTSTIARSRHCTAAATGQQRRGRQVKGRHGCCRGTQRGSWQPRQALTGDQGRPRMRACSPMHSIPRAGTACTAHQRHLVLGLQAQRFGDGDAHVVATRKGGQAGEQRLEWEDAEGEGGQTGGRASHL